MAESGGRTLRAATVNTAAGVDRVAWTLSHERLARAVADLEADVLALQEVDHLLPRTGSVDQAAMVAATCAGPDGAWEHRFAAAVHGTPGNRLTFRSAEATDLGEPSYGVALVTRFEVLEWRELRLPPGRARLPVPLPPGSPQRLLWAPDEQRVALAALLRTPAGPLSAVCTHLSFSPLQAVKQLRRVAAWSGGLPRPLLLLGDLNLPGRVPALLTGFRPLVHAATYPAARPRLQLDHVLADGDLVVRSAEAVPVAGSDHRAAVVDLDLQPPG